MRELCEHNGGTGIGAGHQCKCNAKYGHDLFYGKYHGCSCGAIWTDKKENE